MSVLEDLKDHKKFLVMSVIVGFCGIKEAGVKSNWVDFAIKSVNGRDGGEGIIQGIYFNHDLGVRYLMDE
jgi:hypothetical protein